MSFLAIPAFACLTVVSPLIARIWIGRYEPIFVEFVAILSVGWLVNVLANPAYVVNLGTAALRWVSTGCIATVILNAILGFLAGRFACAFGLGAIAVVGVAAFSLAFGYVVILAAHHVKSRIPFSELLPRESGHVLVASAAGGLILLPAICAASLRPPGSGRMAAIGICLVLATILVFMWIHPMRKRVLHSVFSKEPA